MNYNGTERRAVVGITWLSRVKDNWPYYTAILIGVGIVATYSGIPAQQAADRAATDARFEVMEARQDETDTLLRYIVCTMGAEGRGYDPAACESHLDASLLNYLRPNER